jgi:hypothetical protein
LIFKFGFRRMGRYGVLLAIWQELRAVGLIGYRRRMRKQVA